MRILLLSAYDADSHRRWHKGLRSHFPEYHWTVLTLPPRYFSWRIRGNSLSWSFEHRQLLEEPYDLIIATSMTDLSALRGFVPALAATPTVVYFHENQFAYPSSHNAHESVEPQMLNLYTALCADAIVFNTDFNRQSFLSGVEELLRRLPDHVPKSVLPQLSDRASVLPVPLEASCFEPLRGSICEHADMWPTKVPGMSRPLRVIWAARWEYDKGPELLLAILHQLRERKIDFQICLLGQGFRRSPPEFDLIRQDFTEELVQFGHEPDSMRYRQWLATADVVLSTALHEFQGLAVLEAIAAGCIPLLPNRLSYPEMVPDDFLYDVSSAYLVNQAQAAVEQLLSLIPDLLSKAALPTDRQTQTTAPKVDVSWWGWERQQEAYRQLLEGLV